MSIIQSILKCPRERNKEANKVGGTTEMITDFVYTEELEQETIPYVPESGYARYGYITKKIILHGTNARKETQLSAELRCAVHSSMTHALIIVLEIWVCGKRLYATEVNMGSMSTSPYLPQDEWTKHANEECKCFIHSATDKLWEPYIRYLTDAKLFIINTDADNCDFAVIPTVVINANTRKGSIITDIEEYYMLMQYTIDGTDNVFKGITTVHSSIREGVVIYNPGVVPKLLAPNVTKYNPFSQLVEKRQMTSNGGITVCTSLNSTPVYIDIKTCEDACGVICSDVTISDARTLATIYESSDESCTVYMFDKKRYVIQCFAYNDDKLETELLDVRIEEI